MQIPIIKGDKVSNELETDYRDALPVNMYAVNRPILKAPGYMLCYPGLTKLTDGSGRDRAGIYNDRFEDHYRVSGTEFIKISSSGVKVKLGDTPGTEQVSLPYSFNTQAIIADGRMYLYDPAGGFREITDTDLGDPIDGVWIDGFYFLTDGEYIYHTDITDESSIDPLKFATAEFMPDKSLGLGKTQDNKVIVFGRYTLEYFVNAADIVAEGTFAFQRVETRAQKIGIVATHAKCESGELWYITGGRKNDSLGVYAIMLGGSKKVSTREVDKILSKYSEPDLADMRMECRQEDDVIFILVHLPEETLCFNETISGTMGIHNSWSILKSGITGQSVYRAINGIFDARRGDWLYGDKRNANISILDNTVFTEFGERNEWILYTPAVKIETSSIDELELETIPGHNTNDDAKVGISLTYDGLTYGKEWFQQYGSPLDYDQRFITRRLGYVRDWVGFKFRGATTSRMSFAYFNVEFS